MLLIELILEALAGALTPSAELSKRGELGVRLLFGLTLTALSVAGIWRMQTYDASAHFRWAAGGLFFFLSCFGLFNVALGRKWRWPGCLFVLSFGALFVVRILLGP